MQTYYIANNKTKQATIYKTNKTRAEIWDEVDNTIDVVKECDTTEQAQNYIVTFDMEYVLYNSFVR